MRSSCRTCQTYGQNVVNKEHFPQGMGPVFAEADALGMKPGLWAPVALINSKAKAYVQHQDWAAAMRMANPAYRGQWKEWES